MRKLLSFLVFVILAGGFQTVSAQTELEEALRKYPDSLLLYEQLAFKNMNKMPEDSYHYIIEGFKRSKSTQNQLRQANFNKILGIWHDFHGSTDSVMFYFNLAKGQYQELNQKEGYADIIGNIGYALYKRSRYKEAILQFIEALKLYDSLNIRHKYATTLTNLGISYQSNDDLDQALEKYNESNKALGDEKINVDKLRNYVNIATIHNRKGEYDSAINLYNELIEYATNEGDLKALSIMHNNISNSYEGINRLDKSIKNVKTSYDIKIQLNDSIGLMSALNSLTGLSYKMNSFQEAIDYGERGLALNKVVKIPKDQIEILSKLALAYQSIGDYKKSSEYYAEYINYKDSIDQEQQKGEIAEILEKYESSKRNQEIAELQLEKNASDLAIQKAELAIQKSDNQRNLLLLSVGLFIMLVAFYMYRNRQKQKTNRLLEEKNATISEALKEKEVLLKEIHHRVKNNLQIVSSLLNLQLDSLSDPNAMEAIREGQNRVKSMALIHQKLYMQENLAGINTKDYLEALSDSIFNSYNQVSERVSLSADVEDLDLEIDTIIPIALIVNELITNSIKYAFPDNMIGKISVRLQRIDQILRLEVTDDGVGMSESEDGTSFGMKLVKSLARKLKAKVTLQSDYGTRVQLDISRFKIV